MMLACSTDLKVSPMVYDSKPTAGINYALPFAQFDIAISTQLKECETDSGWPKLQTTVTATPRYENDPSMNFLIDYGSLSNWMKMSDFQIKKYDNSQMLKSVGITSEDKTGKVIVNTVGGLINLAHAAVIAGAGVGVEGKKPNLCGVKARQYLIDYAAQKAALEITTARLDNETKHLKALTDVTISLGKEVNQEIQKKVFSHAEQLALLQLQLANQSKALTTTLEKITSPVVKLSWPNSGQELVKPDAIPQPEKEKINDWFLSDIFDKDQVSNLIDPSVQKTHSVFIPIVDISLVSIIEKTKPAGESKSANGIVYRIPVKGKLMVSICKNFEHAIGTVEPKCKIMDDQKEVVSTSIPQLGQTFVLPFHNGIFQNNLLNAEFAVDGNLSSFQYTEKSSRAEIASDTFNQLAATILQGTKDITPLVSKPQLSKAEEIKAATAELQAQADYEKVKLALQPSSDQDKQLAILASETALLDAQRKRIEAEQALSKAKGQTP